jgi:DNA-binding transcriptional MerR regulator
MDGGESMHGLAPSSSRGADRADFPYKMKDLCERTGLPRQVIHFYIQQGLVPEGKKTGRNMAYYGEAHVERIQLVRRLQHERFLPLKAIRAILEERDEAFSPAQRGFVNEVKSRLSGAPFGRGDRPATVPVGELLDRLGLRRKDLDQMIEIGLFAAAEERGEDGPPSTVIARDDAWMLELFAELRAAGLSEELGFSALDLAMFEEAISVLFAREAEMLAARLSKLPADRAATLIERAVPLINSFLVRYHDTKLRNFFAAM